jgi:[CysO sulfur-carrier protein]-S-L-cysteine hydrolase
MRIRRELIDEIVAHAREDAPNECCGLVAGRDGAATAVHRVANEFASPFRYQLEGQQQYNLMKEIEQRGDELAGIYHSHTRSEAYPSQTDINQAKWWPDPLYLICSIAGEEPLVRAFEIRDGAVAEAELEVEG